MKASVWKHTHTHIRIPRYPHSPVVHVHVEGPIVIDPDWASQEEIPACLWPEVLQVSTLLSDDQRRRSPPDCPPARLHETLGCWTRRGGEGGARAGLAKSQAGRFWVDCQSPRNFSARAEVQTLPPLPQKACGLNAALLFKVEFLRDPAWVEFVRRRLPDLHELRVGVFFLLVAAHALEQRHGEDGVEDHDEEDVEVSVVISLPEAGGGAGGAGGAGGGHGRAAGRSCVPLLSLRPVLQDLLAFGEEKKKEGPVHGLLSK